jgi:hypothetical protein
MHFARIMGSRTRATWRVHIGLLAVLGVLFSCVPAWSPRVSPPTAAALGPSTAPTLKLHLRSGELIIATGWVEDAAARTLRVNGTVYSLDRRVLGSAAGRDVPVDSIALVQSSTPGQAYPVGLMMLAVWGTAAGIVSGSCLADPKSCFGSCPTFYVEGDSTAIQAEGFSASPLRALEARDLDHLYFVAPLGPRLVVHMRNEAMETHAVRSVRLLAAPRPAGGRVFHAPSDALYPAIELTTATRCEARGRDCAAAVARFDRTEWYSTTDSTDLAARDSVELTFDRSLLRGLTGRGDTVGLVLAARHTLVSTFLFYQSLAFAGSAAGDALAAIERGGPAPPLFDALRRLGTITAFTSTDGTTWQQAGTLLEAGPLATDAQVLPFALPEGAGPIRIRLLWTKGYWRLDYAALARLGAAVTPLVVLPSSVIGEGRTVAGAGAAAALADSSQVMITGPGDRYALSFELPSAARSPSGEWELFLESTGWYYEWMRDEWIADENPTRAAQLLYRPYDAFRALAPTFKAREATSERTFWRSRATGGRP